MRYAVFPGGKRFRPLLALAGCEAAGGAWRKALPAAVALELIHCYSLVHDDLPSMDDDDLRRGRPTLHRAFGEALGILAGDALLTLAFEVLAGDLPAGEAGGRGRLAALRTIARAAGSSGMVGGQTDDVILQGRPLERGQIEGIARRKTGALIRAAVVAGAQCAGAEGGRLGPFERFGERLGLAFQIVDDLEDLAGGKDAAAPNLARAMGREGARRRARSLLEEGKGALERARIPGSPEGLEALAGELLRRVDPPVSTGAGR